MTKHIYIALFLLVGIFSLLSTSCNQYSTKDMLDYADSIIENSPDSALVLLESIEQPEGLSQEDYAKYGLLLIKAHKLNRISIVDDAFVTYIVNYYEEHPSDDLGRAYFYAGQVFEEQGKFEQAEDFYLKSINFKGKDTHKLQAYSACFLADIYDNDMNEYKKAISYYNLALEYFKGKHLHFKEENILKLIGDCYIKDQQFDTGVDYYRMAISKVPQDSTGTIAEIYREIAVTLINLGKYPEANYAIEKGIGFSSTNKELAIGYAIKGDIFEKQEVKDSILYYNNMAIAYAKKSKDYEVMYDAYNSMYEIAAKSNNLQLALDNYKNFNLITEIIGQKQKYDDVKFLERKIDFEKNRSQYRADRLKVQTIIFLVILLALIVPTGISYYRYRRRKYIASMNEVLEARNDLIRSVMGARHQNLEVYRRIVMLSISPQKNKYRHFLENINKILFGHDYLFEFDWEYASSLVNESYGNYVIRLVDKYSDLTDLEVKICVLLKIGFLLSEIADITEKSSHTIYKYSSHVRKKLEIPENRNTVEFMDSVLMV